MDRQIRGQAAVDTTRLAVYDAAPVFAAGAVPQEVNLAVPIIFKTIEESGLSTWIRDSPSIFAYWFILSLHAIGMGLLVGTIVGTVLLGFSCASHQP